jgi:hypothetical protein
MRLLYPAAALAQVANIDAYHIEEDTPEIRNTPRPAG